MIKEKLIFDLGFHNGDDSDFYLQKGFDVVAIEANPTLVENGAKRFHEQISAGRLILIDKAIAPIKGNLDFYINLNRSEWSSCDRRLAEIDGSQAKKVSVETTSFIDLCQRFGTPHYTKVDVEGCDVFVAEQLCKLTEKPFYISFETSKDTYAAIFSYLYISGYKKFQLINQLNNPKRSGNYRFSEYSSGFFGKDLPPEKWLSYDETLSRYLKYRELKCLDNQELALGWLDIHASF